MKSNKRKLRINLIYLKYFLFLIAILGMNMLSGCRLFRHKHQTKYGIPSSYYKKINSTNINKQNQEIVFYKS